MKLLLTSAGFSNKTISNALQEMTGKPFNKLCLVFIPTAANIEKGDKDWLIDDLYNCKKLGFSSIDIVDISAVPKNIWQPRLAESDILMFGGGNDFYLLSWIKKSGLIQVLPEMLKTKIYVGISAGSMVTAKKLPSKEFQSLYYEEGTEISDDDGLGFVDFQILPHFNSPYFPDLKTKKLEILTKNVPESVYALDDNSAIKVIDKKITVISEGQWKKFN